MGNNFCRPSSPGTNINYVRSFDVFSPEQNASSVLTRLTKDVRQTTQYFDGLGRPLQTVVKQGSLITGGTATDLVTANMYDETGMEQYRYLPFAANNTGGNTSITDGLFKINPFHQDSVFNLAQFPGETYYYSKTEMELSPLGRVAKSFAPGNSWVGGNRGIERVTGSIR